MMMMIGDPPRSNPTVQIPSFNYPYIDDPKAYIHSPVTPNDASLYENAFIALQRYLPSNIDDVVPADNEESDDFDFPVDEFSCDNFRMFDFKVKKCSRARSHDWTECPFAHPGEKARRRDPRKYHYSGSACPDFRKGLCKRGDACEYAHGVFECWLHPARYRTQPCKDGTYCRRRVCFFAHTAEQLRVLPHGTSPDGSPSRLGYESDVRLGGDSFMLIGCSPPSSPTTSSPSVSPAGSLRLSQLSESMRGLQLNNVKMSMGNSPPSWRQGVGSPRSPSAVRPGFTSLASTPLRAVTRSGLNAFDSWEEEPAMERVESGRELRERIYAKLGKDNSLNRADRFGPEPDVGWVSDLVN